MKTLARFAAVVIAISHFSFLLPQVNAALISVVGDTGDGQIGADGTIDGINVQKDRTGTGGDNSRGLALIYFFALPTLSLDVTITNAELQFDYVEKTNVPEFNIDLFGIDARPNAIIQLSDYYDGNAALSSDSLIQTGIITPSSSLGSLSVANSNLLNFVNSLYNADGTPVSAFSTFRVNPDKDLPVNSGPIRGYFMALANNSNASFRPRLNLTTEVVPEPTSLTLLGIGAVSLFGYGWRRKRTVVPLGDG